MSNAAATQDNNVHPLRPIDLERIIAIDSAHVGEPRRRFFEKRLALAEQHPEDFVHVGVTRDGMLVGFAFARILRGEFGRDPATATLDALGVERSSQDRGVGYALMNGLSDVLRRKKVQSLQSQLTTNPADEDCCRQTPVVRHSSSKAGDREAGRPPKRCNRP